MFASSKKLVVSDNYDDLHQSYGRCLKTGSFIAKFYERFLASHPDVKQAFAKTDFNRQRRLLRRTLTTAIMFAAGSKSVRNEVDRMAFIHSRQGHAPVAPHLYDYWLQSLLATINDYDPQTTPALMQRWELALQCMVKHFIERY